MPRIVPSRVSSARTAVERLAFEILHDEVLDAILISHVVERADVGMRELRDRLGLPLETLPKIPAPGESVRQHLDRDDPLEPRVPRPIDLSHPARAEGREDLVGAETGADGECHDALTGFYRRGL